MSMTAVLDEFKKSSTKNSHTHSKIGKLKKFKENGRHVWFVIAPSQSKVTKTVGA